MKLEVHRFVAGELILKQALPDFAPVWPSLWERTDLLRWNLKLQVFTARVPFSSPGASGISGKVWPRPLPTALIKSTDRSCNVTFFVNIDIRCIPLFAREARVHRRSAVGMPKVRRRSSGNQNYQSFRGANGVKRFKGWISALNCSSVQSHLWYRERVQIYGRVINHPDSTAAWMMKLLICNLAVDYVRNQNFNFNPLE